MVDLFAVLAIMFMIYSTDEITYAKQESEAEIQKLTEQVEEVAEEQTRVDRRKQLAQQAEKTLEQLKAEQAQQAQELIAQFTTMVAAQQSQAASEYENLVAKIELEHDEALEQEETSLQEQSQADLAKKKEELETEIANKQLELEEKKKEELVVAKLQFENELSSKVSELTAEKQDALQELKRELEEKISSAETDLENTQKALSESDQQRKALSAQKKLELANQKKELAKVEQSLKEQAATQAAKLEAEKERALAEAQAKAEQERQKLEAEKNRALAKAEQKHEKLAAEKERALAEAQAKAEQEHQKLEAEKTRALAKAEKERKKLEAEKAQALAKADEAEKLASETEQYLTRVVDELNPYLKAEDAKQEIVKRLKENFKDFDSKAVEIDEKTGKVRLHFQETYFARGSHALSEDMKSFLRIMIPKYAKSIYENKHAAKHIDSLKISGMTSPVYQGKYVDINGRSPSTEKARRYNMKLSNKRALAMFNFIFDEAEMKNFKYRDRLKADMGIAALGFQNAKPVMKKLVGKPAACKQYDCKHEQATVLQFHMLSED